jgi:hypothetical protein
MRNRRDEKGHIVVSVALLLIVLVAFAALATDMGFMYSSRTGGQAIVDAAALAGAASFVFSPLSTQPDTATNRAIATAVAQSVMTDPVVASELTVNVDVPNRIVTVTMNHQEPTFFGSAIGLGQANIRVTGIAEASRTAGGSGCTKPWFIPNSILMDTSACDGLSGPAKTQCYANVVCGNCADQENNEFLTYFDSVDSAYKPTTFAINGNGTTWGGFGHANLFGIRPTSPTAAFGPGQYYSLRLGDSTGGDDYRTNIATCAGEATFCGTCQDVEPGNMIGPTQQGVNDLLPTGFVDTMWDTSEGWCYGPSAPPNGCSLNGSPQLAVAPIWDVCASQLDGCPGVDEFCRQNEDGDYEGNFSGLVEMRIIAYATLFVRPWDAGTLQANLLNIEGCGLGGGWDGTESDVQELGPLAVPVRLIRMQ